MPIKYKLIEKRITKLLHIQKFLSHSLKTSYSSNYYGFQTRFMYLCENVRLLLIASKKRMMLFNPILAKFYSSGV